MKGNADFISKNSNSKFNNDDNNGFETAKTIEFTTIATLLK